MKTWLRWVAAAAVGVTLATVGGVRADDVGKKMIDPVSMKEVTVAKDTPFVAVNSKNLYFVDAKNREAFLKNPEMYLKTTLDCPVRGAKVRANKANRLLVNDQILYFCCANCPQEFQKEPGNYVSKLIDPVSGKEFNVVADSPKAMHKGGIYFFENEDNKTAFEKEPAKYAKVTL
jgi:YHS domain-containing protein